jgi:hypothetical protein
MNFLFIYFRILDSRKWLGFSRNVEQVLIKVFIQQFSFYFFISKLYLKNFKQFSLGDLLVFKKQVDL